MNYQELLKSLDVNPKLFVINLKQSSSRWNTISSNLSKHDFQYQRFEAVLGKAVDGKTVCERASLICRTFTCSKGFFGASMSHIKIWQQIASEQYTWAIILEDDVKATASTRDNLTKVFKFLLTLDPNKPIVMNMSPYNLHEPKSISFEHVCYMSGLSAYIINKKAAAFLTQHYENHKLNFIIDLDMSLIRGIQKYSTCMPIFYTSFDVRDAVNKQNAYVLPILQTALDIVFNQNEFSKKLNFIINSSGTILFMRFTIPNGWWFLLTVLMVSFGYLWWYVSLEILVSIGLWIVSYFNIVPN